MGDVSVNPVLENSAQNISQQDQYNGQQQRRPDPNQMYNADGTPRRPRQNQNSGNRGGNYNDYNDYGY